jgi:hypothetical protein
VFLVFRVRAKEEGARLARAIRIKDHFTRAYLRGGGLVLETRPRLVTIKDRAYIVLGFYEIFPFNLFVLREVSRGVLLLACWAACALVRGVRAWVTPARLEVIYKAEVERWNDAA